MRVKFLQAEASAFGQWQAGDEEDIHTPEATRLIERGIAVAVAEVAVAEVAVVGRNRRAAEGKPVGG